MLRFAPLGLPQPIRKYGGSVTWALSLYWLLSTILRSATPFTSAIGAGIVATCVEFFKLHHSPSLDAFRLTLPGILLLGRFFSPWDIVAYWLAILAGALLDTRLRSRALASTSVG